MYADSAKGFRGEHLSLRDEASDFDPPVRRSAPDTSARPTTRDRDGERNWSHDMYDGAQRGAGPIRRGGPAPVRSAPYGRPAAAPLEVIRPPPRTAVNADAPDRAPAKRFHITLPGQRTARTDIVDLDRGRGTVAPPIRSPVQDRAPARVERPPQRDPFEASGRPDPSPFAPQPPPARAPPARQITTRAAELRTGLPASITITNLAKDLTQADVQRLCSNYGRCSVTAFASGARGSRAEVTFANRGDAVRAAGELEGNELDGDGHVLQCSLGRGGGSSAFTPQPAHRDGR